MIKRAIKYYAHNPRLQLLIIAASLLITTTFLSLSAFLTDTTTFKAHLDTSVEGLFGVSITAQHFQDNEPIIPLEEVTFDPVVENQGRKDAYVFLKVSIPVDEENADLYTYTINSGWTQVEDLGVGNQLHSIVYGYGNSDGLTVLEAESEPTVPLFNTVTMKQMKNSDYLAIHTSDIEIKSYAIQSIGISDARPDAVWSTLQGNLEADLVADDDNDIGSTGADEQP